MTRVHGLYGEADRVGRRRREDVSDRDRVEHASSEVADEGRLVSGTATGDDTHTVSAR